MEFLDLKRSSLNEFELGKCLARSRFRNFRYINFMVVENFKAFFKNAFI